MANTVAPTKNFQTTPVLNVAGDAFALLQDGSWKRIGSTDVTMRVPGMENDQVFVPIADAGGFEVRCYKDFAWFCDRPAASVAFSGIVPSA